MQAKKLCLNDAFSLVRARKPDVSPNFHFMQQLDSFERQLQEQTSTTTSTTADEQKQELRQVRTSIQRQTTDDRCHHRSTKYSCTCFEVECKCFHNDLLGPLTGVSPDSGIEFDRWTPSDVGVTPK
jgi:dual specificity MAP kinase phosphatase